MSVNSFSARAQSSRLKKIQKWKNGKKLKKIYYIYLIINKDTQTAHERLVAHEPLVAHEQMSERTLMSRSGERAAGGGNRSWAAH